MTDPLITQAAIEAADEEWRRWPYRATTDRLKALEAALGKALPHIVAALAAQAGEPAETVTTRMIAAGAMPSDEWVHPDDARRAAAAATAAERERTREALGEIRHHLERARVMLIHDKRAVVRTAEQEVASAHAALLRAADFIERGGES